jgi:hypothetical protein
MNGDRIPVVEVVVIGQTHDWNRRAFDEFTCYLPFTPIENAYQEFQIICDGSARPIDDI